MGFFLQTYNRECGGFGGYFYDQEKSHGPSVSMQFNDAAVRSNMILPHGHVIGDENLQIII